MHFNFTINLEDGMEGIQVSTEVAGSQGEISIIKVGGFIDTTTSAEVERALNNLLKSGRYNIIIDLRNVDYISSAGWGIFISEIKTIREHNGDLKLARMIPDVYEIFELLEFHHILEVYDTLEEAVRSFEVGKRAQPAVQAEAAAGESAVQQAIRARAQGAGAPATATVSSQTAVAQEVPGGPGLPPEEEQPALPLSMYSTEEKVKHIVAEHPEWGAFKINKMLNTDKYGYVKLGWFGVRSLLNRLNLNSRKKRRAFAENYRKSHA